MTTRGSPSWTLPGRLRSVLVERRSPAPIRYAGAVAGIAATAVAQIYFFGGSAPWFLYTPAVVLIAALWGFGAGVLATALAALAAGYVVVQPGEPLLLRPVHWAASIVFTITTLGLVGLVKALRVALQDSTALQEALDRDFAESARREAFLSSVLAASTDCIKVVELDGSLSFMSEGGMKVMDIGDFNAVRGCPWPDLLKDGGVGLAREALAEARQGRTSHFEAPADTYIGTPKWWSVSVSPIAGPDGRVERILSVSRDHTALHQAREQQELLNGELAHRLKNTMSVIQAIASQTFGASGDRDAVTTFNNRVAALARAHDVLTAQSWSAANIGDVATRVLATFGEGCFAITGPEVTVGARAALALSLLLHELATTATKHGALSVAAGRVDLTWEVRPQDAGPLLCMTWVERGGPPAIEPTRRGFGSRIIRMGLTGSGGTHADYGQDGLRLTIDAPLDQLQQA